MVSGVAGEKMELMDPVEEFYRKHLSIASDNKSAPCPFCKSRGQGPGRLAIVLNPESFFYGYFRCSNSCIPGGFPLWYAKQASIDSSGVPGYDPDRENLGVVHEFPVENINDEIALYQDRIGDSLLEYFRQRSVSKTVLNLLNIGFNGRYIVYPYFQEDGNCYSARCVYPEKKEDFFWQGDESYTEVPYTLFNRAELEHCEQGTLFICEDENSLLTLKQLGFPAVAVPHHSHLDKLPIELFAGIKTIFVAASNSIESIGSSSSFASRFGYRARILPWPAATPARYSFVNLAEDSGKDYGKRIGAMIRDSRSFSPFSSPKREYQQFLQGLKSQQGSNYKNLVSGFPLLDDALGGIHGINIIGGGPKVGKSTFTIQVASQMAQRKIPVLYYDFENGRQKIYQRTLSRLSRLITDNLHQSAGGGEESFELKTAKATFEQMLFYWRVINDRTITPELMRKHIEFIRHETRSEYTVVVIDSLHKLPFKEFSEQRTGIDAWLRQMESIRDELNVSFLVISELSRGAGDSYDNTPHLGVFKGSGDIEYSADNAMVLFPATKASSTGEPHERNNCLWLVASREHSPGRVANYNLDYPFWGFVEQPIGDEV
ncbi:DnaB-like helicase C-terminal domain-containing protein [Desulforhopalus sp. 52FAK]